MRSTTRKTLTAAIIAQRYKLEREMARGGMGTVWLARDTKLGRLVAIKVMAKELAQMSEALARFEREALAVAQLRSAHVVQVFDYGLHEGLPYIVMELLEGENLAQRLKRMGRLGLEESIGVVAQICKGLKAAHGAGLIHRDLKPSNIFIARRDDEEVVKLLDFGVVKAIDPLVQIGSSEATSTGILLGTPQYMSPEQARATKVIDNRSDLWSVAVIVFRMLTGHNPFKGDSVGDVVLKICSDALPHIREHAAELPESLDEFFEKAFARSPDDRFQSAVEMSRAFVHYATIAPPRVGSGTLLMDDRGDVLEPPLFPPPYFSPELSGDPRSVPHGAFAAGRASTTPIPPGGAYEATPISTTVGGTPIASKLPPAQRPLGNQPVAVVIAGAAVMLVAGALAAVWLVGASNESGPAREGVAELDHMVIPEIEVPEGDDERPAEAAADTQKAEAPAARARVSSPSPPKAKAKEAPASSAPVGTATSGSSKTGSKGRPDWGL